MKLGLFKYFLVLPLLLGASALLANSGDQESKGEEKSGVIVHNENDNLTDIIEKFPSVKDFIEKCDDPDYRSNNGYSNEGDDKDKCVWELAKKNQIAEKIIEHLEETKDGKEVKDTAANYGGNIKKSQSKATKVLQDYLAKRLSEAMYGEEKAKGVKSLGDHDKYYELYKSQLGRTLISTLSSYCIFSDPKTGKVPFGDKNTQYLYAHYYRKQNLKNLNIIGDIRENQEKGSQSYDGFNKCISLIGETCRSGENPPVFPSDYDKAKASYNNGNIRNVADPGIPHPCEINRFMSGVRKGLATLDEVIEETSKNQGRSSLAIGNVNRPEEKFQMDAVVNIGSKEVVEDSGYKEALEDEEKVIAECLNDPTREDCQKYITDKEENDRLKDEHYIRGLAAQEKLKKDVDSAEELEELEKYFLDQGVDKSSFDKIVQKEIEKAQKNGSDTDPVALVKDLIKRQYANEKEALHKGLTKKLAESEIDKSDPTKDPNTQIKKVLKGKQRAVASEAEDLAAAFHYGNVVSSFIEVTGGSDSTRNTRALAAELDSNFFTPGRDPAAAGDAESSILPEGSALSEVSRFTDDYDSSEVNKTDLNAVDVDAIQYGLGKEEDDK